MKNKYVFTTLLLLFLTIAGTVFTWGFTQKDKQKEEELFVVTSFYPMYIAALNVAGECEDVQVANLSEPQTGCLHDYQLTPQDMILLSEADVFIVNGGGIESFLVDVAKVYPQLTIINAGEHIFASKESNLSDHQQEEHHHDGHGQDVHAQDVHIHDNNAHAWMSIPHYMEQVEVIRDGLAACDPKRKEHYETAAKAYLSEIELLRKEAEKLKETATNTPVILLHEAFAYLAEDYGMYVAGELNLDEERQVSAGEIADLLKIIREKKISILFAEDLYGSGLGDTIEAESDCRVYYLNTLVRGEEDKDSWLQGMEQNIQIIKEALQL